jgi:hypothetical protein
VNVWKSHTTVVFSVDGHIEAVYNFLNPLALDDTKPSLSLSEIEEVIRQSAAPDSVLLPSEFSKRMRDSGIPVPEMTAADSLELVIYPSYPPRLANICFRYFNDRPHRIIVDAHTGEILSLQLWGNEDRVSPSRSVKQGRAKSDSNAMPIPLHPRPIPIHRGPHRDEGAIDSLMPADTGGQSSYFRPRRHGKVSTVGTGDGTASSKRV